MEDMSAIEKLTLKIKANPDNGELYYQRGVAYDSYADHAWVDDAINDYNMAIEKGFINFDVYFARSEAYYAQNDYVASNSDFDSALISIDDPLTKSVLCANRGREFYYTKKEREHAITYLNKAMSLNPRDLYTKFTSNRLKSEQRFEQEIMSSIVASRQKGEQFLQEGYLNQAFAEFRKIIPEYTTLRCAEERIWMELGQDALFALKSYAEKCYKKGDYNSAITCYSLFLEKGYTGCLMEASGSRDTGTFTARGMAYYQKGENARALSDFNAAIDRGKDIKPCDVTPYYYAGIIYFNNKDYRKAISNLEVILQLWEEAVYRGNIGIDVAKIKDLIERAKQKKAES